MPHQSAINPDQRLAVPALGRAAAVLDLLAATGALPLSEMARQLGIAKSTLHGLCETMVQLGLLQTEAGGFGIGSHVLGWSAAYLARNDLARAFARNLAADPRLQDYTITLSRLEGDSVVYLACRNASRPLGFTFGAGMRLPAVFSATGKAILSQLPDAERSALLAGPWPAPYTPQSTPDLAHFEARIPQWRQQGYAVDPGEIRAGMTCVGVPVLDASGRAVAGLAVSMTDAEAAARGIGYFSAVARDLAAKLTQHSS